MGLFDRLIKYNACQLFVGEVYEPHAFKQDENGYNTGEVKASSVLKKDICVQNQDGDYVSVVDGTIYSAGTNDQIISGNIRYPYFFWKVKPYREVSGKKSFTTSKYDVVKLYEKMNTQYRLDKLVLFTAKKNNGEIIHILGCYIEKDIYETEGSRKHAEFYPWDSFFSGNRICYVDNDNNLVYDNLRGVKITSADSLILACPEVEDMFKHDFLKDYELDELNAYIKIYDKKNNLETSC